MRKRKSPQPEKESKPKHKRRVIKQPKADIIKFLKQYAKKHHKTKHFKVIVISIAVFLLFFFSIFLFKGNDMFAIKNIRCTLSDQDCPPQYYNLLTNVQGANLFDFDVDTFQRNLINLNPAVKDVQVNKYIPNSITFTFILRKPMAVIVDKNNRTTYVDDTGKIYSQSDNPGIPHIFIEESVSVGETAVSPYLVGSIDIIHALEDSFIPVKEIDSREKDHYRVTLHTGQIILMDLEKDKYKQVDALQLILQNSKMVSDGHPIKTIDLRYDSPIVR